MADDIVAPEITLNDLETRLRQLLLDVANFIESNPAEGKDEEAAVVPQEFADAPLELRWTGGWVRDKLLGIPSHDIDVAINKMTGYQFGLRLKEYLDSPGNATKYGLQDAVKKAGSLAKIAANPEKSKHLETVTTRIMGLDLDLVNLRKETYTEESRNPAMEFGTPVEDALRRDATINAMFYNIQTGKIEDFTKQGLKDLKDEIIRTPLEPFTTFDDDPLRVLRLIRFASRYGYKLEERTRAAMAQDEVKRALVRKITKERVWTEFEKMMKGPNPKQALQYIDNLGLYSTIFLDPTSEGGWMPETVDWKVVYEVVNRLLNPTPSSPPSPAYKVLREHLVKTSEDDFFAWLLASFVPWVDAPMQPPLASGKAAPPLATTVAREGLKAPNKLTDLLTSSIQHRDAIRNRVTNTSRARDQIGMEIRGWGPTWPLQVLYSMLADILERPEASETVLDAYAGFVQTLVDLELSDVCNLKPLIDGKQLATLLNTRPGPWMKPSLDIVMAWQLRHPGITDPKDAVEEVRISRTAGANGTGAPPAQQGELTLVLIHHFLHETLRPYFSQARPAEITPAGRRKLDQASNGRHHVGVEFVDASTVPWKGQDSWTLDILAWICTKLTPQSAQQEWGVLLPPILSVAEDTNVQYRAKGARFLEQLLRATPSAHLARTGLAPLFEELLMTNLSYLPTLTKESDTIRILNSTFPALLALTNTSQPLDKSQNPIGPSSARTKLTDAIMRKGLLFIHSHCSEHYKIIEVLLNHLPSILTNMGLDTVKYLKDLLPMLSRVLSDPFGPAHLPLLELAAEANVAIILNAWPRIGVWRTEILKGMTLCWIRLNDEPESDAIRLVRQQLRTVAKALAAAHRKLGIEDDLAADVNRLIEAEASLKGLFGAT